MNKSANTLPSAPLRVAMEERSQGKCPRCGPDVKAGEPDTRKDKVPYRPYCEDHVRDMPTGFGSKYEQQDSEGTEFCQDCMRINPDNPKVWQRAIPGKTFCRLYHALKHRMKLRGTQTQPSPKKRGKRKNGAAAC